MSALYEQARAKALEIAATQFPALGNTTLSPYQKAIIDGSVTLALDLVEQEARRRADDSRTAADKATPQSVTQIGFSAESYAYHSLADFCRSQRGTP